MHSPTFLSCSAIISAYNEQLRREVSSSRFSQTVLMAFPAFASGELRLKQSKYPEYRIHPNCALRLVRKLCLLKAAQRANVGAKQQEVALLMAIASADCSLSSASAFERLEKALFKD